MIQEEKALAEINSVGRLGQWLQTLHIVEARFDFLGINLRPFEKSNFRSLDDCLDGVGYDLFHKSALPANHSRKAVASEQFAPALINLPIAELEHCARRKRGGNSPRFPGIRQYGRHH